MTTTAPTRPPMEPDGLQPALRRNIRLLRERREREAAKASFEDRLSAAVTRFTGSMLFVWLHLSIVIAWIAVNLGVVPAVPAFDETFVILATAASVEAIFLSTFVLISQNRASEAADRRDDLDLQINLLSEHEITRLIVLVRAVADKLGVEAAADPEMREAERDVAPERVLDEIENDREAAG